MNSERVLLLEVSTKEELFSDSISEADGTLALDSSVAKSFQQLAKINSTNPKPINLLLFSFS